MPHSELGIYDKTDPWLNEHCECGHIRYSHRPGGAQGTLDCAYDHCSCQRFTTLVMAGDARADQPSRGAAGDEATASDYRAWMAE